MKRITTLAHAVRRAGRRSRRTTNANGSQATAPAGDYLVEVDLGRHAGGERPATVQFTLGELLECETLDELLRRARDKAAPVRSDPAEFKGRPIIDHLKALGVPEDTARYERERGVTTVYVRLGELLRERR